MVTKILQERTGTKRKQKHPTWNLVVVIEWGHGINGDTLPRQIQSLGISIVQSEGPNVIFQISNFKLNPLHNLVCTGWLLAEFSF